MSKMIEIAQSHWIDPDIVEQAHLIGEGKVRRGHWYFDVILRFIGGGTTTLGGEYTAIQANKIMKRIANAQSKPTKEQTNG